MDIEVGNILEGKIIKIKPFGAIVLIDNKIHGLIHISHISSNYIQDINDHLKVGDIVKVKVLSVDKESNKLSLSIKDIENDPSSLESKPLKNTIETKNKSSTQDPNTTFEEKFKEWLKASNERQAGINKRNKRR